MTASLWTPTGLPGLVLVGAPPASLDTQPLPPCHLCPQYLPEPTFRDWAFRPGECGCARVIMLLGCVIQFWIHQTDSPTVRVAVSQFPLGELVANAARFGDTTSQRYSQFSWLRPLGRTFQAALSLTHSQRWSPRGLHSLSLWPTTSVLEATAPIPAGAWVMPRCSIMKPHPFVNSFRHFIFIIPGMKPMRALGIHVSQIPYLIPNCPEVSHVLRQYRE